MRYPGDKKVCVMQFMIQAIKPKELGGQQDFLSTTKNFQEAALILDRSIRSVNCSFMSMEKSWFALYI